MQSLLEYDGKNKEILIIIFGGLHLKSGGILPFEFLQSLTKWFPNISKKFYIDLNQCWYHEGIKDITSSIEETKGYLREVITPYKTVVFIGTSAGGYAAILFGSLLNVTSILAFIPQTMLTSNQPQIQAQYRNLKPFINNCTKYIIYGDTSIKDRTDLHHVLQVNNLQGFKNVNIVYKNGLSLKSIRDSGELRNLIITALK
jgi:hypothetical protein